MYDAAGGATAAAVAKAAQAPAPTPADAANAASAADAAATAEHPADAPASHAQDTGKADKPAADVGPFGDKAIAALTAAEAKSATAAPITEVVFVDSRLPDIASLVARPGVEIVILDASKDGISQVSAALAGLKDLKAIHFVSHGESGEFDLGATEMDAATLAARGADIASWSASLAQGADIMIWGCDVAALPAGQALVSSLSALTGADVAASANETGATALGGDWVLEVSSGTHIDAVAPFEAASLASWDHLLVDPTITNAAGDTAIKVVEPSSLNAAGADSALLSAWDLGSTSGGTITVSATVADTTVGTLSDSVTGGVAISGGWQFTGTLAQANAWLDGLRFTAADVERGVGSGSTSILLSMTDGGGGTASKSIGVTVTPSNDPTVLTDTSQHVTENAANVSITALQLGTTVRDPEVTLATPSQTPDQIVYSLLALPTYGYLTLNGDRLGVGSIFTQADIIAGNVKYTHTATGELQNTNDSFRVSANDGATPIAQSSPATVTLIIDPVNAAPTVGNGIISVYEGVPYNANAAGVPYASIGSQIVLGNGGDPASDTVSMKITSLPSEGLLHYTGVAIINGVSQTIDRFLTAADLTGAGFIISDANKSGLTYQHNGAEPDANPITAEDSFNITAIDSGGGTGVPASTNGTVRLNVLPVDDDPTLTAGVTLSTTVTDTTSYTRVLTTSMLSIDDVDTANAALTFNLSAQPQHGYLLLNGTALSVGSSFSMADLIAGRVSYVQIGGTTLTAPDPITDTFHFVVRDNTQHLVWQADGTEFQRAGGIYDNPNTPGQPLKDFTFTIGLALKVGDGTDPAYPAAPPVVLSGDLYLGDNPTVSGVNSQFFEGGTGNITTAQLNATALGVPSDQIVYSLTSLPSNGSILVNGVALGFLGTFTQADIDAGRVSFQQDGGEVFKSSFTFSVTGGGTMPDGTPISANGTFDIYTTPVNDTPTATGGGSIISERDLSAAITPASDGAGVRYITTALLNFADPDDVTSESYIENPGAAGAAAATYLNNAGRDDGSVTAGGNPYAPLQVVFTANPAHGTLEYFNGTSWVAVVLNQTYTLNADPNNTGGGANIISITGAAGTTGLRYVNDGSEARTDAFTAKVVDHAGAEAAATVNLTITPVNDPPSVVVNQALYLFEGSSSRINIAGLSTLLDVTDPDSSTAQVQLRITQSVQYGQIVRDRDNDGSITDGNYDVIGVGSSFTMADLEAGKIYYIHDGSETYKSVASPNPSDKFVFTLADGVAEVTGNTYSIFIKPTNDAPTVTVPSPIQVVQSSGDTALNVVSGVSVADPDVTGTPFDPSYTPYVDENSFLEVTVRLRQSDGTLFAAGDYSGLVIGYAAGSGATVLNSGNGTVLTLYGTKDQVNAALAGLSFKFSTDRNATYKVEVIVDDRTRDASGALVDADTSTGAIDARANGGLENDPVLPGGAPSPISNLDPDKVSGDFTDTALTGNVAIGTFQIYASTINNAPTVTYTPGTLTPTEDTNLTIIDNGAKRLVIHDVEAEAIGAAVQVNLGVTNGNLYLGSQAGVTVSGNGTGAVTLIGTVANIQALLDAGVTYRGSLNFNATEAGLTVTVSDRGSAGDANNDGVTDVQTVNTAGTFADAVDVNDAPTLSVGSGTIYVTDTTKTGILGASTISDVDSSTGFVQATVRILDASGNPLSQAAYNDIVIGFASSTPGVTVIGGADGNHQALVIQGNLDAVNTALAGLSLNFGTGVTGDAVPYKLQVVADDRLRDGTGALIGNANGGALNQTNSASPGSAPTAIDTTTQVDPYAALPALYNVVAATRNVFVSGVNDPATITAQNVTVPEGGTTVHIDATNGAFTITDADSNNQPTMSATVTVPSGYTLSTPAVGGVTITGGGTTTLSISGATAAQLTAIMRDLTVTLPDPAGAPGVVDFNGSFSLTVVVNDGGSTGSRPGTLVGDTGDASANPGDYGYEDGTSNHLTTTRTIQVTVSPVNDAPQVTGGTSEPFAVTEDVTAPTGSTVSTLFSAHFTDPLDNVPGGSSSDSFAGIAITGLTTNAAQGVWQYNTGSGWVAVGTRTVATALYLDASAQLRFVPAADYQGTPNALTVVLVETDANGDATGSVPASGSNVNLTSATGGTTRYSSTSVRLNPTVSNVNDRPTLGNGTVATLVEDSTGGAGQSVTSLLGATYGDARDNQTGITGGGNASTPFGGIAIVGNAATAGQGTWQYSVDGGTNWLAVSTSVSDTSAVLLSTSALVRFVPSPDYNGTPGALTVRGADTTVTYSASSDISATVGDQTSTWSTTHTLSTTVTPLNDAPVLTGTASSPTVTENGQTGTGVSIPATTLVQPGVVLSDIDLSTTSGLGSTVFGAGTITVSLGATYRAGDVLGVSGALPTGATATLDPTTHILTITLAQTSTLADVASIIEHVTYASSSDNPTLNGTANSRTYTITVQDGNNVQAGGNAGGPASLSAAPIVGTITINATNDAPIAVNDTNTTNQNTSVGGDIVAGGAGGAGRDSDPEGDTLTVTTVAGTPVVPGGTTVAGSAGGTFTVKPDGTYTFNPGTDFKSLAPGETATTFVTYAITDGHGGTATARLTVTVTGLNDAPAVVALPGKTDVDAQIITPVNLATGFADPDHGDTLTFTATGLPPGLTLDPATGLISGTPNHSASQGGPSNNGVYAVTVVATDSHGGTATQTFNWTITNPPPVAANDTNATDQNTSVGGNIMTGAAGGAGRDSDPDGDTLTVTTVAGTPVVAGGTTVTGSAGGTFIVKPDGTYVFNPGTDFKSLTPGQTATTSVTYAITDGEGGTATATLTVTVTGLNDAPVAVNDTNATDQNTSVGGNIVTGAAGGVGRDSDPDGDTLTVTTVAGTPVVAGGTTVAGSAGGTFIVKPDGTYTLNPGTDFKSLAPGETATTFVTYAITDGHGGTATATLTVTVTGLNDAPAVVALPGKTDVDAQIITPVNVSAGFADPDHGDSLTFTATGLPPGLTLDPATGVISGTPNHSASQGGPSNNGVYAVTVVATDSHGGTATQTFNWTITNPPPVAVNDTNATDQNTSVGGNIMTGAAGGIGRDSDPDGDTLTVTAVAGTPVAAGGTTVTGSAGGTFTVKPDGTYTFNPGTDFKSLTPGQTATTSVTYAISDGEGGTATATLTVTVTGLNDAPVAVNDTNATDQNTSVGGNIVAGAAGGVGRDSDPDGDTLTVTTVAGTPVVAAGTTVAGSAGGTFIVKPDGTYTFNPGPDFKSLAPGQTATTSVTYAISDGAGGTATAVLTVTVTGLNDAPIAVNDTNTTDQNTSVGGNIVAGGAGGAGRDSDPEGDALTVTTVAGTPVVPGGTTVAGSAGGTFIVKPDGTYTFNPGTDFKSLAPGETATTFVTYAISDGHGGTATATLTVTVTGLNDAPAVVALPGKTDVDAQIITPVNLATGFADPDHGDTLTFTATGLPPGLTLDPATGLVSGTPNHSASQGGPSSNGVYAVTVVATDSHGGTATQTFNWTITNPSPVAVNDTNATDQNTSVGGNIMTGAAGGAGRDSDPDGDTLTVTTVAGTPMVAGGTTVAGSAGGTFTVKPDGTYTFNPGTDFKTLAPGETATTSVTYAISDGEGGTATAVLTVTVTGLNDAPAVVALPGKTDADAQSITPVNLATGFADPDHGDSLTFTATGLPPGLTLDPATGVVSGTPNHSASQGGPSSNGVYAVTVVATDSHGGTATQTFNWTITNPPPVAANDTNATDQNTSVGGNIMTGAAGGLGRDSDPDGDTLTVTTVAGTPVVAGGTTVAGSAGGTFIVKPDGTYTFNPGTDFLNIPKGTTQTTSVTYTISDGEGGTATAVLTISVTGVNRDPVSAGNQVSGVEDGVVVFKPTDFPFRDADVADTLATVRIVTLPAKGGLYLDGVLVTAGTTVSAADIAAGKLTYRPLADGNGAPYSGFTFQVSDGTVFSPTATMTLVIDPLNDRPTAAGAVTLGTVTSGDGSQPPSATVDALFRQHYSDLADDITVSGGSDRDTPLAGVAITGNLATATQGAWQYNLNDGRGWQTIPASGLSDTNALVLPGSAVLRFVPAAGFSGEPGGLVARLSDGTGFPAASGTPGQLYDLSATGNGALGTQTGGWSQAVVPVSVNVTVALPAPLLNNIAGYDRWGSMYQSAIVPVSARAYGDYGDLEGQPVQRFASTWQMVSHQLQFRQTGAINLSQGSLFYEARLGRDTPLPSWISFDPSMQVVTAVPHDGVEPGIYVVRVVARDVAGHEAESSLTIYVLRDNSLSSDAVRVRGTVPPPPPAPAEGLLPTADAPRNGTPAPKGTPANAPAPQGTSPAQGSAPQPRTAPQQDGRAPGGESPPSGNSGAVDNKAGNQKGAELHQSGVLKQFIASDLVIKPSQIAHNPSMTPDIVHFNESLTKSLFNVGATGRLIEAARLLEALAADART